MKRRNRIRRSRAGTPVKTENQLIRPFIVSSSYFSLSLSKHFSKIRNIDGIIKQREKMVLRTESHFSSPDLML